MKRLFVAIKINPDKEFLNQVHSLETSLQHERIKWVEDHNIHITLKFFGETEEKQIPGIISVLKNVSAVSKSFSYSLKNLGIFGSSYEPRVIWIGLEPYQELVDLMKKIQSEMIPLGFEPDRQNLVPHLTLGRIKYLKDKPLFQRTIDRYKSVASSEMKAESFILFESILKKEGPVYVALDTFPFLIDSGK
jgi:RNA 2',3'-cyclic 3'-phosphodiesterase